MKPTPVFKTPLGRQEVLARYEALLSRWPLPYERLQVETRFGETSLIACGTGPALVLLHGAASNSLMWAGDVSRLATQHRVYAIDILGEPGLSAENRLPFGSLAHVDWLLDVLDALELPSVRLQGLSHGGYLALELATSHPERVNKLVLLSPAGVVADRLSFLLKVVPLLLLGSPGRRAIARVIAGPQSMEPTVQEFVSLLLKHVNPRYDAVPLLSDDALQHLTMPVLLLGGEKDAVRDCHAIATRLGAFVPRLEASIAPNAGHALVGVADRIAGFLEA